MQINILDSRIRKKDASFYDLTELDFHPCKPFFINHPNILPESADIVKIKGILEHTDYIRYILKTAESLLKVSGKLIIEYYFFSLDSPSSPFRNLSDLMHEVSISFKERVKLVHKQKNDNIIKLIFEKSLPSLPPMDNIQSWSFGIVSDGKKNERILRIIDQIERFSIPNFEVLICGPAPSKELPTYVSILSDEDLYFDGRAPISKKKNHIVENAKYNNLVLIHDRFSFPEDWYSKIVKHGNYFDGFCIRIIDEETKKNRIQDWISTSLDHLEFKKLFHKNNLLDYDTWVPNWNLNGGFLIIKKHLFCRVKFNPYLHWGEAEDGDLCRRLDADGFCLTLFADTYVTTLTYRLKVGKGSKDLILLMQIVKRKLFIVYRYYYNKTLFRKYITRSIND